MEKQTKWLLAIGGAVTTVLVALGIYEEKKSSSSSSKTTSKAPPAGGCPAGTYWNGNACIHQVVFQGPQPLFYAFLRFAEAYCHLSDIFRGPNLPH